ncbi:glycosyltransferase family 2 protein [Thalassotalea mangrovi]|uniref:Glycosyltransferase family 2 protein n=1 Tax=Thalassotalea mangrovi TaxID=2572245 RepID=A0A4U1B4N4_9GAMM|nr:glycosyltransferase family 2 protein [Thalassotalea mangrovi]TKB45179.1 glycosyltransferase family 2 protein [Thalassotalea mangrovi]
MAQHLDKVSIIMSTFNSLAWVGEAIESVIAQSYGNWELLITDDASEDNTRQLLEFYAQQYDNVYIFFNEKNMGAAYSRNRGIAKATGRYLAFLDADDSWQPNKLAEQVEFMQRYHIPLSCTSYQVVDEHGKKLGLIDQQPHGQIDYDDLLKKRVTFGCSTVIVDKNETGYFLMPEMRTGQDYATWLGIIKKTGYAYHYPQCLTNYRITPGSISRNKFRKALRQWQIYRQQEKLSLRRSTVCFLNYAYRAIFRK